ncbi:helix-turn-helix domain-containing protein [Parablautia intestinalis]|uniref:Helix-turn-helix domain-containing protein n=1 Tax=Parablautia intestinalis TaxID=2320100 RepID=A0A3A9B3J1_9FIRM|nr:helix-turn-helix domain-containing protein [Parablautia intestinalis]
MKIAFRQVVGVNFQTRFRVCRGISLDEGFQNLYWWQYRKQSLRYEGGISLEEICFEPDCNTSIPHFHSEMEILYVLSGRIAIIGSGYNYVLEAEDFIVLNPYEHHELYAEAGCHTLSGYISADVFRQSGIGRVFCCSKSAAERTDYLNLIRTRLAMLLKYDTNYSDSQRLYVLSQLFGLLAILKAQFEISGDGSPLVYKDADRMQEVLTYLSVHFSESITMKDVAERVYLSKSHLSREFQKYMGISFSDYLRKIRLNRVAYLLAHSGESITDIALSCGFSNVNTMILNFREEYKETPGTYRKNRNGKFKENSFELKPSREITAFNIRTCMSLLKYAAAEEAARPLDKKQQKKSVVIHTSLLENRGKLSLCHNDTINIGWADSLLNSTLQEVIMRTNKEVGFRYIRFHGILDDSMDVYHEYADGRPWFSFTYLDMVMDEILDLGLKPFFEFGYTPYKLASGNKNVFGTSCINVPNTPENLAKWELLADSVMKHLLERFGYEEVRQWRFSAINGVYISYGVFSAKEYLACYERTYRSVRRFLPEAQFFGFGLDTGFLSLDGTELLERLLDHCIRQDCMPDAFGFQCFGCDYSKVSRARTEDSISVNESGMADEPASVSSDPDILKHEIALCKEVLKKYGLKAVPLYVTEWNSTIWQNDPGNDTCFKAAFIMKNVLENCGDISGIAYTHLTDHSERRVIHSSLYHGGYGMFTYNGIAKAGYYASQFLSMLAQEKGVVVENGEGYLITRSQDCKRIQIVLYHYCHYDMENRISHGISVEEQRTVDRYYGFERKGTKSFHLHLENMPEGTYLKRSFSISREHGSSYDLWMSQGAPDLRGKQQINYLSNVSTFHIYYEPLYITQEGEWIASTVLDEHEVRLILIEKK